MPLIKKSNYNGPPLYLYNGYLQTIAPHKFRRFPRVPFERERIDLADGDFLDLDWWTCGKETKKLVILSHGLEGNSRRPYIRIQAKLFIENGWDVLAWNCRSCSEEINLAPRLYYHGDTEDLEAVVKHAIGRGGYTQVALIGISMGGSIILKYAGTHDLPAAVQRVVAISVPCRLSAAAEAMDRRWNRIIFGARFLPSLRRKLKTKEQQYPGLIDMSRFDEIEKWRDLDEWFSAPMFGFRSAEELYEAGSADNYLSGIQVPTLILNALNDPILPPVCSPTDLCAQLDKVWLEVTETGGHAGYTDRIPQAYTYAERRAFSFCEDQLAFDM